MQPLLFFGNTPLPCCSDRACRSMTQSLDRSYANGNDLDLQGTTTRGLTVRVISDTNSALCSARWYLPDTAHDTGRLWQDLDRSRVKMKLNAVIIHAFGGKDLTAISTQHLLMLSTQHRSSLTTTVKPCARMPGQPPPDVHDQTNRYHRGEPPTHKTRSRDGNTSVLTSPPPRSDLGRSLPGF